MSFDTYVLIALALLALYLVSIYNKLIRQRNLCKNAFSQIDVQLKRRLINTSDGVEMPAPQFKELDAALARLNGCTPRQRRRFFDVCMVCVMADGGINLEEAHLLRGV